MQFSHALRGLRACHPTDTLMWPPFNQKLLVVWHAQKAVMGVGTLDTPHRTGNVSRSSATPFADSGRATRPDTLMWPPFTQKLLIVWHAQSAALGVESLCKLERARQRDSQFSHALLRLRACHTQHNGLLMHDIVVHGNRTIDFDGHVAIPGIPSGTGPTPVFCSCDESTPDGICVNVFDHVVNRFDFVGVSIEAAAGLPESAPRPFAFTDGNAIQPLRRMFLEVADRLASNLLFDSSDDRSHFYAGLAWRK